MDRYVPLFKNEFTSVIVLKSRVHSLQRKRADGVKRGIVHYFEYGKNIILRSLYLYHYYICITP